MPPSRLLASPIHPLDLTARHIDNGSSVRSQHVDIKGELLCVGQARLGRWINVALPIEYDERTTVLIPNRIRTSRNQSARIALERTIDRNFGYQLRSIG